MSDLAKQLLYLQNMRESKALLQYERDVADNTIIRLMHANLPEIIRALEQYEGGNAAPAQPGMVPPVVDVVLSEVTKAVSKFPTWPTDPLHALAVLGEEYGELTKATLQLTYEPHKTSLHELEVEALQTAAMALRFLQSLKEGRYLFSASDQHRQSMLTAPEVKP